MLAAKLEVEVFLAKDVTVEEGDPGPLADSGAGGQLAFAEKIVKIAADFFELQLVGPT